MSARVHLGLRLLALALALLAVTASWTMRNREQAPVVPADPLIEVPILSRMPAAAALPPLFPADAAALTSVQPDTANGPPEMIGVAGRVPDDIEVLVRLHDGSSVSLRVGEAAAGWTLLSAAIDRAVFKSGTERRMVTLEAGP